MERKEMEHKSMISAAQLPGDDGIDRRGMLECTSSCGELVHMS
jgi:hypothetical protein